MEKLFVCVLGIILASMLCLLSLTLYKKTTHEELIKKLETCVENAKTQTDTCDCNKRYLNIPQ